MQVICVQKLCLRFSTDESFICCLSSMNLELYDEWKDTNKKTSHLFLDAVLSEFIDKTEEITIYKVLEILL